VLEGESLSEAKGFPCLASERLSLVSPRLKT